MKYALQHYCIVQCLLLLVCTEVVQAQWSVTARNTIELVDSATGDIVEMSGVTYLGPSGGGLERFATISDSGNIVAMVDVGLSANGSLLSAEAVSTLTLSDSLDFEGIAYTDPLRNSVFVSEETNPGVHEYDLVSGNLLQTVSLPPVFQHDRANRGFESLTRSPYHDVMWTANEEALTVDGPAATQTNGTMVRLQRFDIEGNSVSSGPQFAYEVEPYHGSNLLGNAQSGLSDLVVLPDGNMLALERSAAIASPLLLARIFQINFLAVTDVSKTPFDVGLIGQSYTPIAKDLLFSGEVGSGLNANLEGLALGPQLANGNWTLVGVVDNGGGSTGSLFASFEITPPTCSLAGDYNCDGTVTNADYATWKSTFGSSSLLFADGSGNGLIDEADYTVWLSGLGATALPVNNQTVPEPASLYLFLIASLMPVSIRLR